MGRFVIIGERSPTNSGLIEAFRALGCDAEVVAATDAGRIRRGGDVLLGRVASHPRAAGTERDLEALDRLERAGGAVLNRAAALRLCRDKLATAERLRRAGVPHPPTAALEDRIEAGIEPPLVVKPRFGSDGANVHLCVDERDLEATIAAFDVQTWACGRGAIVQELIPTGGQDLRVIVAGERVVGAMRRIAPPGRWHTGGSSGGRCRTMVNREAAALALSAAAAVDADLVGVDLATLWRGQTVIDVNGCVEFADEYSVDSDAFEQTATALVAAAGLHRVPRS